MIYSANRRYYKRLIFDGDSLTYQFQHAYAVQTYNAVNNGDLCYYNFSFPGHTLQQRIDAFSTDVAPNLREDDIVIIWCGTNDLAGASGVSAATLYSRIQTYCGLVHALGGKVIVCNVIARSILGADLADMDTRRLAYNLNVRNNWATFADGFADLGNTTHLAVLSDALNTTYYQADEVHLTTSNGYPLVSSVVAPEITTILSQ